MFSPIAPRRVACVSTSTPGCHDAADVLNTDNHGLCVNDSLHSKSIFKVESEFESLTDSEEEENEQSDDSGRSNVGVNGSEDEEQTV